MLGRAVFLLVAGLAAASRHRHGTRDITPPKWPSSYKVDAEIHYQLTDVREPVTFWIDDDNQSARADVYGGTNRRYFFTRNGNKYVYRISPRTTETTRNEMICKKHVERNPLYSRKPEPLGKLPDMTNFTFVGNELLFGKVTQKWQSLTSNSALRLNISVSMWVTYEKDPEGMERPIPLRFVERSFSPLRRRTTLGSSIIDYYNYEPMNIDPDMFLIKNMTCWKNENHTTEEDHFSHFKTKHGKEYSSEEEHSHRMHIFRHNLRNIEAHNRAGRGYKLAVNHLADRTPEELGFRAGLLSSRQTEGGLPFPYELAEVQRLSAEIPQEWDWRMHGAVTPVKNQLVCGSCWAFATVGAVEGALKIHSGKPVERLSEQALIDCSFGKLSEDKHNNGCDGGEPAKALEWVKTHGLPRYLDYGGYLGVDGFCHHENVTDVVKITDYVRVPTENADALRLAVYKHGPVVIGMNMVWNAVFYSEGVYMGTDCKSSINSLTHDMLVVGYGVLDGQKYWLVKNSLGSTWGLNGYLLMAADRNTCGILLEPIYAFIE